MNQLKILLIVFLSLEITNLFAYTPDDNIQLEKVELNFSNVLFKYRENAVGTNDHMQVSKQKRLTISEYDNIPQSLSAEFYFIPKFSIKTNLVYLIGLLPDFNYYTPIPNLEAEYFITPCWSVAGTGAYAKWGTGKGRMFGISSWSLEPRFWLEGIHFIDGFYLGLYGMAGDFDKKGYSIDPLRNNRTGSFWGGGLSLGGQVLFNEQWGMEIGLRVGARYTETDLYCDQDPNYYRDETYTKTKFDLQGLKVAIVYRFGIKIRK